MQKKQQAAKATSAAKMCGVVESFEVSRVRQINSGAVFFTLKLNGVDINNCRVVEGKNGDFIAMPQYKGSNGAYYNVCYFRFSADDEKTIIAEVERALNEE